VVEEETGGGELVLLVVEEVRRSQELVAWRVRGGG